MAGAALTFRLEGKFQERMCVGLRGGLADCVGQELFVTDGLWCLGSTVLSQSRPGNNIMTFWDAAAALIQAGHLRARCFVTHVVPDVVSECLYVCVCVCSGCLSVSVCLSVSL
jgi:hypothetical protein